MSQFNVSAVCARLKAEPTFATLFSILREYGDVPAARWLRGEREHSWTYAEMTRRADDYAACLTSLAPARGWMAIAVDTCVEWPALFWGIVRSGHNALLLDASAADPVIQGLLEEAGCRLIITRKPRGLSGEIRQIDFRTVADCPRTIGYEPVWGEYVAMCTSGTTGRSRIFAYNAAALCAQALDTDPIFQAHDRIFANENRRLLALLPFHHVLGFMTNVIWSNCVGMTNLYLADRTPNTILTTCRLLRPQLIIVVPLVGNSLVKALEKQL